MKNNFVKCFRTSVKKNIGVKETMDFLIGYIAGVVSLIIFACIVVGDDND